MTHPLIAPVLVPFVTAIVCLFFWKFPRIQQGVALAGAVVYFLTGLRLFAVVNANGVQAVNLGNWQAPVGINFVADLFSASMVAVTGLIAVVMVIYSLADIDAARKKFGYFVFLNMMLMGVTGAFLTGDIFNMFVWFEVMLLSSFVLMTLGGERAQMEGAIKYVVLNLISSNVFLAACGIIYGKMGSLNMADIALRAQTMENPAFLTITAVLFLVAFGIKSAMFPLFFWLPASYHTPPVAVSAIFAGLLTKVGVYALFRVFTLIFNGDQPFTHTVLLILSGFTMVVGVLGAVAQYDFRRLLSFHIVSQIGYMILGLALFTPLAIAATLYFVVHNIFAKSNLFLVSGIANRYSGTFDLKKLGGLYTAAPYLAILFFLSAMSLAGIPPLSGFFAKFGIIKASLAGDTIFGGYAALLGAIGLGVGMLTLFSMTKIWNEAFWKKPSPDHSPVPSRVSLTDKICLFTPVVILAALTVLLGILPEFFFDICFRAAEQMLDPDQYIQAVLGGRN